MKKLILASITLTAIGVAVRVGKNINELKKDSIVLKMNVRNLNSLMTKAYKKGSFNH